MNSKMHKSQIELPLMPADSSAPVAENRLLNAGAVFSNCRQFRYRLWRIWDDTKPLVMFIGLNPSTANESDNDPTIKSVIRIAKNNGYGGVYMMNCFPFITPYPEKLLGTTLKSVVENYEHLQSVKAMVKDVVFAWGNFKEVTDVIKNDLTNLFPDAKALSLNKNGSPKHPLYCKSDTIFVEWKRP